MAKEEKTAREIAFERAQEVMMTSRSFVLFSLDQDMNTSFVSDLQDQPLGVENFFIFEVGEKTWFDWLECLFATRDPEGHKKRQMELLEDEDDDTEEEDA